MAENEEKSKMDKIKESSEIKKEETILKANEKKMNAKIKIEEKRLERKQARNERRLEAHLNLADVRVEEALEDADLEIALLSEEVDLEIANGEGPEELILFKASNILEEILLRTQLRLQMAKNELIANLQSDLEDGIEVAVLEENLADLKEKSDHMIGTLEGKIETEKEEFNEKYGEDE